MNQFQQYMINHHQNGSISTNTLEQCAVWDFPDNIPLSSIIPQTEVVKPKGEADGDYMVKYKECALKLFDKYIKTGAQFEINISYVEHERLCGLFDDMNTLLELNMNLKDLLLLFEPSKRAMFKLLGFSLTRFKTKDDFKNVQQALSPSGKIASPRFRFTISSESV